MVSPTCCYDDINYILVAPDAYDVVMVGVSAGLTPEQRGNLSSAAKLLQCAASNRGFGPESPHLQPLNQFIRETHIKFKSDAFHSTIFKF